MKIKNLIMLFLGFATLVMAEPQPLFLQQKLLSAQAGEFIVMAQEGNYSLLFLRSMTADTLLLEEISVPEHQISLKTIDWKNWVSNKAPGHTSWILYEIDQKTGQLIECFSYSKNGWLYLDPSEQFLTRLLTLPLFSTPEKERKRIGPSPINKEEDHRSFWTPALIIDGKKKTNPSFEVLKTQWPDDGSRLALCSIELYFDKEHEFPLPYWLEVSSPHYTFKMRAIDSGHSLVSPMTGAMPHRLPKIPNIAQKGVDSWKLHIQTPSYFQKLHLFALDLSKNGKVTIPIPFEIKPGVKKEEIILEMKTCLLNQLLINGNRYQWVLIPEGHHNIYVESEEIFTWKNS